jgi:hypothetical protein
MRTNGGGGAALGGGIFNHSGSVTIQNSTLSGNSASGGDGGYGGSGFGAALFNLNGTVTILGSSMTGNIVSAGTGTAGNGSAGGAVYNLGYDGNLSPHATIAISSDTVISGTIGGSDKVNNKPAQVSGGLTNKATASIIVPPKAPSGLYAKAVSPSQIDLSWKDNSNNETGFKIERRAGNCESGNINPWAQIAAKGPNVVFFANTGLAAVTTYSYRIKAYNLAGESSYTGCASATSAKAGTPRSPSGLEATSVSSGQINLSWKDNSARETFFRIFRKTGTGFIWTLLTPGGVAPDTTKYSEPTAAGNNTTNSYSYYIQACNDLGCSPPTSAATVPLRPTGLAAATSELGIKLSWTDRSNNETGFQVYKKTGECTEKGSWALLKTTAANAISYADDAVTADQPYSYRVKAYYRSPDQPNATGYSMPTGCADAIATSSFQNILTYNGHTYAITKSAMNWADAKALAVRKGVNLVTVNDSGESSFLSSNYGNTYGNLWIGLNDRQNYGTWVWADGTALGYTNWAPGEPSAGTEHCVMTNWGAAGMWNNGTCPDIRKAIVEW